ncbi:MAG: dihydrodipicolinate synthase family protein, partial [Romboutsia sp.]|nr:dihydrodipicolinate synthase family protein [Romboutsia sp.]
ATVGKLSECKNIIGIKDATGDISRVRQLKDSCGEDFALLSGDDSSLMEFIGYGGHGVISVLANVVPKKIAALCDLAKDDIKKATALNEELLALNNVMHLEVNPVTIKFIMQELGLIKSGIRLPLVNLSDELKTIVRKAISKTSIGEININYYADA